MFSMLRGLARYLGPPFSSVDDTKSLRSKLHEQQAVSDRLQEMLMAQELELQDSLAKLRSRELDVAATCEERDHLAQENTKLRGQLAELLREANLLKTTLDLRQAEYEDAKRELLKKNQHLMCDLRANAAELRASHETREQLEKIRATEVVDMRGKMYQHEARILALTDELHAKEDEIAQQGLIHEGERQQRDKFKVRVDELTEQLENERRRGEAERATSGEQKAEVEGLRQQVQQLVADKEVAEEEHTKLQTMLERKDTEIKNLELEIKKLTSDNKQKDILLDFLKEEIESLELARNNQTGDKTSCQDEFEEPSEEEPGSDESGDESGFQTCRGHYKHQLPTCERQNECADSQGVETQNLTPREDHVEISHAEPPITTRLCKDDENFEISRADPPITTQLCKDNENFEFSHADPQFAAALKEQEKLNKLVHPPKGILKKP